MEIYTQCLPSCLQIYNIKKSVIFQTRVHVFGMGLLDILALLLNLSYCNPYAALAYRSSVLYHMLSLVGGQKAS